MRGQGARQLDRNLATENLMAKRMSNKERIQRQALEVAAGTKEKAEKAAKKSAAGSPKKKAKTKKAAATPKQLKVVWVVFNDRLDEVATFPYSEKEAAEQKAAKLTEKSGKRHFVDSVKVPIDDQ